MSEQYWRDVTQRLFPQRDAAEQPDEDRPTGNHSPHEGNNPPPTDEPMRTFVRVLFSDQ